MMSRRFLHAILASSVALGAARSQQADLSKLEARPSAAWVRDAVIYELNPRTFSASGSFNGVTARLDDLRALGVTVVWLMPIHPIGVEKKKGSIGSPYAVRDYYGINPAYGTRDEGRIRYLSAGGHQHHHGDGARARSDRERAARDERHRARVSQHVAEPRPRDRGRHRAPRRRDSGGGARLAARPGLDVVVPARPAAAGVRLTSHDFRSIQSQAVRSGR